MPFEIDTWWNGLTPFYKSCVIVIAAAVVFWGVRRCLIRWLQRLASRTENDLDDRLVHFASRFYGLALFFILLLAVLQVNGIKITPLLASAGIAGIALGLAAKETLADILAGIFLIMDRPVRLGDRVKIDRIGQHWGSWGDVVDIGLRRTLIRNTDGVIVNYPNAILANSVITNFSFETEAMRVRIRFQVAYDADLERVRRAALKSIGSVDGVLPDTPEIVTRSLWDDTRGHLLSGILVEGRYRIADIRERTRIRSRVLEALLAEFRNQDIRLAESPPLSPQ